MTAQLAGEYLYAPTLNAATDSGEDAAATLLSRGRLDESATAR